VSPRKQRNIFPRILQTRGVEAADYPGANDYDFL